MAPLATPSKIALQPSRAARIALILQRVTCIASAITCLGAQNTVTKPNFFARRDYAPIGYDGIAVADTNRDKIPDLIGLGGTIVTTLFGNGNGTFHQGPATYTGLVRMFQPVAADLNGDAKTDLVFTAAETDHGPWGFGVSVGNGDGTFETATFYQIGADLYPGNVVLGDFNGDGIPDVALASESGVWLFIGKAHGAFKPGVLMPMSQPVGGEAASADFNSDGHLDLAVTTSTGFAAILGNGDGTFQAPRMYNLGLGTLYRAWVAAADLNRDGKPDVVVAAYSGTPPVPDYVEVYLGTGTGSFTGPSHAQLSPVEQVVIGDVNADGIPDLVGGSGFIALGNGDGTFKAPRYYPVPSGTDLALVTLAHLRNPVLTDIVFQDADGSISVLLSFGKGKYEDGEWTPVPGGAGCGAPADFNGDGRPDLAVNTPSGVALLLGTGNELLPLKAGTNITLAHAGCLVSGDLNSDGIPDLLVPSNGTVVAYLGNGDGTFTQKSVTSTPTGGYLTLGDFNHDGKLDFATSGNLLALGNGDGTFQTPVAIVATLPLGGFSNLTSGDVNADGWIDLVLTSYFDSYIYVLLNDQHGGFTQQIIHATQNGFGLDPFQVLLPHLTTSGNLDMVLSSVYSGAIVYLGDGKGGFTFEERIYPENVTTLSSVVAVGDVNGDRISDLVMTQGGGGSTLGIFLGNGDGTFRNPFYIGTGPFPGDLRLVDLHNQPAGLPDIVVPDGTGGVMVLINATK